MNQEIFSDELKEKILVKLGKLGISNDIIKFESLDEGQAISVYVLTKGEGVSDFLRNAIVDAVSKIVPLRKWDNSWYVLFKQGENIVDSYFGGDIDNPYSGVR